MDGRVTNGLRVGWVTPLAFYEKRMSILRSLEDQDVLHAFFVREKDTGAKVGKPHHELRVGARGILAVLFPPEDSGAPVLEAVRLAFEELAPKRVKTVNIFTQHVLGLEGDYTTARRALASSVASGLGDRINANDSAVLIDGSWEHGDLSLEFGVVNATEIEDRLVGGVGRAHAPRDALSSRPIPDDLPDVALYVEATRKLTVPDDLEPEGFSEYLLERWAQAADDSDEVAGLLLDHAPVQGSVNPRGVRS